MAGKDIIPPSGPTMNDAEVDGDGSVTHWIEALRSGEPAAAQALWDRYFRQLVELARKRMAIVRKAGAIADEEDAALSAFTNVCLGLGEGRFPDLSDRNDLWRLLVLITSRKAINQTERWGRKKRGGGAIMRESELESPAGDQQQQGLDQMPGPDPTPEFLSLMAEQCQSLLQLLGDDPKLRLVEIALWKMEGLTHDEIALRLKCSRRTVANRLTLIQKTWEFRL